MASEKIYLIDESLAGPIAPDYDLLLDSSFNMEDYIEIKEKKLPGNKASFNNIENAVTKEVCVTGLLLNFSQDLSGSKLSSILRRNDIEYLYLYADTIIINDKLSFPQAHVTITCRRLIMEEQGTLSTIPEPHAVPYAQGSGGDIRKAGAPGEPGGNISVICNSVDNRHPAGETIFFLNGADGQNGERGDVKRPPKPGSAVAWADIEKAVMKHDYIEGNTSNWKWADFDSDKKKKIYYAKAEILNYYSKGVMNVEKVGDENWVNQDNGADAVASGPGGNGGKGGTLYMLFYNEPGQLVTCENKGGQGGKSVKTEPGKKAKDSTYYHIELRVFHNDGQYKLIDWFDFKGKFQPFCKVTKELKAIDGNAAAPNPGGQQGADGKIEILDHKYYWLCPVLLEKIIDLARINYRDGERRRAKWILDRYSEGLEYLNNEQREDVKMAALIREMEMYQRKLSQNLDFYGYPPGWVPKLSARSNLGILVDSRRDLAELIYFASDLLERDGAREQQKKEVEWTAEELKKGIKSAQADINAAFDALPQLKYEISVLEGQVTEQLTELRHLKAKIISEIRDQARSQALFTGSFEILAGICTMIPVGQPYLGQLGGGILTKIGSINIDAEKPLGEALSFAGGLSNEIGSFAKNNEAVLKAKANSQLSKEIDKGTKELSSFSEQAEAAKLELQQAENAIQNIFIPQEVALLREQIRIVRNSGSGMANPYNMADDYGDILARLDEMKATVKTSGEITAEQKQTLQLKLDKLATDKKELAAKLKARKADKERREKNIEKAGKVIKGFTDGFSQISSAVQSLMVEFDEDDPAVQEKMEEIKKSKYKGEFETIYDKIADINKLKLPLVEKLVRFEQKINSSVQRINNNLVQWSVLSDQRVLSIQYGLMPATRASLKKIAQESWDLLMLECYYLTKSYQYRFLKKIDPVGHGMEKFLNDIKNLVKAENQGKLNEEVYKKIFSTVLKSQFKALAKDLLINVQTGAGKINIHNTIAIIKPTDKNADGESILDRLNNYGRANFRLEDIRSYNHGTDAWMHYRIVQIVFERIEVNAKEAVSFAFGIRHSGDSYIRAANKKLYYFTSRSQRGEMQEELEEDQEGQERAGEEEAAGLDLQVQSWNASYSSAAKTNPAKD